MFRIVSFSMMLALMLATVGCRACYSPYETCQPTFIPERGDQCMGELYRSGSILGGMKRTKNDRECQTCNGTSEVAQYGRQHANLNGPVTTPMEQATPSLVKVGESLEPLPGSAPSPQDFSLGQIPGEFNIDGSTANSVQSFSESVFQEVSAPGVQ